MLLSVFIDSFRGISDLSLSLGQKTHIIGENGSGKTHILDAVHLLSGGKILYGKHGYENTEALEAVFQRNDLTEIYREGRLDDKDYHLIKGKKHTRPKYLTALPWRTVYISPFDMNLLYFAPGIRRDAIDDTLARTYEQFRTLQRNYEMTLRSRNALLKKIKEGLSRKEELNFWDKKFGEYADTYGLYRERYIDYIRARMSAFGVFFGKYQAQFEYRSNWIDKENRREYIENALLENRDRDILTGHTHIGPHRDDWGFVIQANAIQIPAESYLSRGEMKMLLLGLKILEREFVEKTLNKKTILLIDDIFAELDDVNASIFLESLTTYQVILTSQKPLPGGRKWEDFICINLKDI